MRLVGVEGLTDQLGLRVQGGEAGDLDVLGFMQTRFILGALRYAQKMLGTACGWQFDREIWALKPP